MGDVAGPTLMVRVKRGLLALVGEVDLPTNPTLNMHFIFFKFNFGFLILILLFFKFLILFFFLLNFEASFPPTLHLFWCYVGARCVEKTLKKKICHIEFSVKQIRWN